jgi:hypothetical protein
MQRHIEYLMREKRISTIMGATITEMKGMNKLDAIYFKKAHQSTEEHMISGAPSTEFVLKPDVVIAENGLDLPKINLEGLIENKE